jgi:hypothetical protein
MLNQSISVALKRATYRQAEAYHDMVLNMEEMESFCLKALFLIDEGFGGRLASEDTD